MATTETYVGGANLLTPHDAAGYPGAEVLRPGPAWDYSYLVPTDGLQLVPRGGERLRAYRTPTGGVAEGFELRLGDRVTRLRSGLPFQMCEWRVERAS
jgi:hypothetical protein